MAAESEHRLHLFVFARLRQIEPVQHLVSIDIASCQLTDEQEVSVLDLGHTYVLRIQIRS